MPCHNGIIAFQLLGCQLVKNKKYLKLLLSEQDAWFFKNKFILNSFFKNFINNSVYHDTKKEKFYKNNDKNINIEMPEYRINNHGFRCDNFNKRVKTDILFAGCSETFGYGGPLEQAWPFMLNKHFNIDNYFNVALPGAGYQQIIHNCLRYIEYFDIPKNLFILFPNIERHIIYNYLPKEEIKNNKFSRFIFDLDNSPEYYPWSFPNTLEEKKSPFPVEFKNNIFSYKTKVFEFYQSLIMLEQITQLLGINFYWTMILEIDRKNMSSLNLFDCFVDYSFDDLANSVTEYKLENKNIKNIESKPDGHFGIAVHEFWKNLFLDKVLL